MLIRSGMGMQLSGSVGGVTASRNSAGAYLRNRTVPVNPNSVRQQSVRSGFAAAAEKWRELTAAQREGWAGYATGTPLLNRLGESITLSGFAMYCRVAAFIRSTNPSQSIDVSAPSQPGLSVLGVTNVLLQENTGITITIDTPDTLTNYIVAVGPSLSSGVSFPGGPVTAYAVGNDFAGDAGAAIEPTESFNRYGLPVAGQRRVVRIAAMSTDGRLSDVWRQIVTVGAAA